MLIVNCSTKLYKYVNSKQKSTKEKFSNILKELRSIPKDGPYYKSYKGERLYSVEKNYKISNFEIHSIKLEDRIRLVYEFHNKDCEGPKGDEYNGFVTITDIANHEYKGKPYVSIFSNPKEIRSVTSDELLTSNNLNPDDYVTYYPGIFK